METYSVNNTAYTACAANSKRPSDCIPEPSSLNPYSVHSLDNFTMAMLTEIISNQHYAVELGLCWPAAAMLPPSFEEIDKTIADPRRLNLRLLDFWNFTSRALPVPLNASSPAVVADWWWNRTVSDRRGTGAFIDATRRECLDDKCAMLGPIGDPDIAGIGMLISTAMLIVLACLFAIPAAYGWHVVRAQSRRRNSYDALTPPPPEKTAALGHRPTSLGDVSRGHSLRRALIFTLDDLVGAVVLFTLSVLVAALILRLNRDEVVLRYNMFMAETLALVAAAAMVMIAASYWATYWQVDRVRLTVLAGFVVNAVLTVTLFAVEFAGTAQQNEPQLEWRCLNRRLGFTGRNDDDDDRLDIIGLERRAGLILGFVLWLVALLASLLHLPQLRHMRPTKGPWASVWYFAGLLPMVAGGVVMFVAVFMFGKTYELMKTTYGGSYTLSLANWSFGQVLALATWVEPFMHFLHLIFGKSVFVTITLSQCAEIH